MPTDIIPGGNVEILSTETDSEPWIEEYPTYVEPEKPYVDLPTDVPEKDYVESVPLDADEQ